MNLFKKISYSLSYCMGFLLMNACQSDLNTTYAPIHVFFRAAPVTAAPPLFQALNNPGIFCQIQIKAGGVQYKLPSGKGIELPFTQVDKYTPPILAAGLLVGTPNFPDLNGNLSPVVFDLVCSNCYYQYSLNLPVFFESTWSDYVQCRRCHRIYDLSNGGVVRSGEKGRPLFRYHYIYNRSTDTFVVRN